MEFNFKSFESDLSRGKRDRAFNKLFDYAKTVSGGSALPADLLTSPSLLLRFSEKDLAKLERVVLRNTSDTADRFIIQAAHQCKWLHEKVDDYLKELTFSELLVHCGYWYELRRFQEGITMIDDPNTIEVINTMLNRREAIMKRTKEHVESPSNSTNFLKFSIELLAKIQNSRNLQDKLLKAFHRAELANHLAFLMEKISLVEMDLSINEKGEYLLSPKDESKLKEWKQTDLKYLARHFYFSNLSGCLNDDIENEILGSDIDKYRKEASLRMLSNQVRYLAERFPEQITMKNGTGFSSMNFFNYLNTMSQHANSRWNHPIEYLLASGMNFSHALQTVLMGNLKNGNVTSPVFSMDYHPMSAMYQEDFQDETKAILDFLIHRVGEEKEKIDLRFTPLLRVGQVVFWLPGILANKDYGEGLQVRLILDSLKGKDKKQITSFDHQAWADEAPKFIENIFKETGYEHTITERKYAESDIDLAVYKDGHLFIFEIKYTYGRSDIREVKKHTQDEGRSLQKARLQIGKHLNFLSNKENIHQLLAEMGVNQVPDEVKVIPFILDNTFEDDGVLEVAGKKAYKLSNLELEVILRNQPYFLLSPIVIQQYGETLSSLSLWRGEHCTPLDLLYHIKNSSAWKGVINRDELKLEERKLSISEFTVKYRA